MVTRNRVSPFAILAMLILACGVSGACGDDATRLDTSQAMSGETAFASPRENVPPDSVTGESKGGMRDARFHAVSEAGHFVVELEPRTRPIPLAQLHEWTLRVERSDGEVVSPSHLRLAGGMPAHGHGLVTAPRVTRVLSDREWLVEGMKFHMGGAWELRVEVVADGVGDLAVFDIDVGP